MTQRLSPDTVTTRYWHTLNDGRIQCDVCPRFCKLHHNQRGLCFIRQNQNQQMVLTSYARSSGFAIDPIEKKPLNHFYPGSAVLSFGTAGCNLACKFCQNWDMSKSQNVRILSAQAEPLVIAQQALALGCQSVAYTYNDPVIFHEYALDTAQACQAHGIKSVAVSAGYVCAAPRAEFYRFMDAANIDLKAFSEKFYWQLTGSHLQPVLETLQYIYHETSVWLEITTLLIPGENDSVAELEQLTQWVVEKLGTDVPLHFSAFHPDWKMRDKPPTPLATLLAARQIGLKNGLRYVYIGNAYDKAASSTVCHACGQILVGREGYRLSDWYLTAEGTCTQCGTPCAGHFAAQPGTWGAKRLAVRME